MRQYKTKDERKTQNYTIIVYSDYKKLILG